MTNWLKYWTGLITSFRRKGKSLMVAFKNFSLAEERTILMWPWQSVLVCVFLCFYNTNYTWINTYIHIYIPLNDSGFTKLLQCLPLIINLHELGIEAFINQYINWEEHMDQTPQCQGIFYLSTLKFSIIHGQLKHSLKKDLM